MGCTSSSAPNPTSADQKPDTTASPDEVNWKAIHSAIRWNKPIEEIKVLLTSPAAVNCEDEQNGNRPIHIAAQNGHLEILQLLVKLKVEVDSKNAKGNTGIHMAIGYDYYECAKLLIENGADAGIINDAGFAGNRGLDGDKTYGIAALMSATSPEEVMVGFSLCEEQLDDLTPAKASFVSAGLKAKSTIGKANWTAEMQDRLKTLTIKI